MFKKMRRISTLILMFIVMISMAAQSLSAATIDTEEIIQPTAVEPRWRNISYVGLNLNLSDPDEIYFTVNISGYSGTTYTNGTVTLADVTDGEIDQIDQWSGLSSDTATFEFEGRSIPPVEGRTYRLTITITTIRNGSREMIVQYIDRTC